ncbi:TetR/AcrR family transcriptional regulator [Micromonospora polyrhachis]|uniref:TetR/AcrR family tetracycline transcriptional repressor n=1 Tax=Micromonospora polyrhachis TaxID=1282883 RepID=A0A7W7SL51_9ACTN|nr:TetR/AcrR family transcriptional regulator C-terminal domain-containing protein [Micromonospora polyrhachis]MBB4956803.1 TetR/AcrR family tetracycline transcriptional repressor [Micromonospora polyrhachis]
MATRKLDPPTVVGTALKLLNDVGLDGLSLRRLAQELGVQGPALYRHFASKQDLLRAMADAMFASEMAILERPPPRADWADWLIARSHAVRRVMLSYRDGGRLKEHLHNPSDQWPGLELLLQMMEEAGFSVESALYGIYTVGNHILGTVIAEQELQARQDLLVDQPQVDLTRFPRIAYGTALRSQGRDFDREFEYGLHLIISGLRASLDEASIET